MSVADFLLSPAVQKTLSVVFAEPDTHFSSAELLKRTKLELAELEATQGHLVASGILTQSPAEGDDPATVAANKAFIFYNELRAIALKSFAAAEPIRKMLRSKFRDSVVQAFVLGEKQDAAVEVLVVHGQLVPQETEMAAACKKLSTAIGRHLVVHVISTQRYEALTGRDHLHARLRSSSALQIIAPGDTKARLACEPEGLLQSARKKLAALAGR
ncbi:hypothetical protein [Variovorax sp. Sphag1AA]|uniref:hypothetical protein n=1 Tax=Variovorax sp. Sphag1AA TaxID=2587027 RepID=UPI00160D0082|nr:hypothetical protein [Variovorax sp. Sphag1AA]MBB3178636.1 hypothetical protein [Variovorax sp. Sphag1AA]